jgi:hypothetical protein
MLPVSALQYVCKLPLREVLLFSGVHAENITRQKIANFGDDHNFNYTPNVS